VSAACLSPREIESSAVKVLKSTPGDVLAIQTMTSAIERGLMCGEKAEDADLNSVGGAYFLFDVNKTRVAVFKPCDEEAYAPNNPRNYKSTEQAASSGAADERKMEDPIDMKKPHTADLGVVGARSISLDGEGAMTGGMKRGVAPQTSAVREVAAYLLDHGLAGVPRTAYISYAGSLGSNPAQQEKVGSVQEYIGHLGHSEDWSPSMFDSGDVQAIAALDIRLLNQDRHTGNILVCQAVESAVSTTISESSPFAEAPAQHSMPRDVYGYTQMPCVPGSLNFQAAKSAASAFVAPARTPALSRVLALSLKADVLSPRGIDSPLSAQQSGPAASPGSLKSCKSCPGLLVESMREKKTPPALEERGKLRLVPIDHGYTLPHPLACDEAALAWMAWPQARQPPSDELQSSIERIDVEYDVALLEHTFGRESGPLQLPRDCIMSLRVGTVILKVGMSCGRSLYDLGCLITGPDGYSSYPPAENVVQRLVLQSLRDYRTLHKEPDASLLGTLGAEAHSAKAYNFLQILAENLRSHFDDVGVCRNYRSPTI